MTLPAPRPTNTRFIGPTVLLLFLLVSSSLPASTLQWIRENVIAWVDSAGTALPWVVAVIAVVENIAPFTLAFPGSLTILVTMSYAWTHPSLLVPVWLSIFAGGVTGNIISYGWGRFRSARRLSTPVMLPKWFKRLIHVIGPLGTVLRYVHPHSASYASFIAGAELVSFVRYLTWMIPSTLLWYVGWGFLMRLPGLGLVEWPHWTVLMYATVLVWFMVLFNAHEDVLKAFVGWSALRPVRPDLDDKTRLEAIGAGNALGAVAVGVLYCWLLRACYAPAALWVVISVCLIGAGVYTLCVSLALGLSFPRLMRKLMPGRSKEAETVHNENLVGVRVAVLLTTIWIAVLIYATGGLAHSPFVSLGLTVVVVGQFIASAEETHRAVFACGIIVISLTEWILPLFGGYNPLWISENDLDATTRLRVAFWIMTLISMGIGVVASGRTVGERGL